MSQPVGSAKRRGRDCLIRLALAGAVAAGAGAVVPAAQADTFAVVRGHVHQADAALHSLAVAAAGNGSVRRSLADLEAQLSAAGKGSAQLYRRAHTPALRTRAASALTKVAAQENRDAIVLTPLIGHLTGSRQADVAGFIASATQGREQALSLVTPLVPQLPGAVRGQIAGVVAQLSNAGTGQVVTLAGAILPGSVACGAVDSVSEVVATVIISIQADLTRVQSILPFLPAGAQAQIAAIVKALPDQLNALLASLKQGLSCPSGTPATADAEVALTSLVGSLQQGFLPGIAASQTPAPVTVPGPISSLLNQVTTVIPGLGGLFGGALGSGLSGFGG